MVEEKMLQNREDIIRIEGQLKLINQKLDNHIGHISGKVDTIFRIVWTVSFGDAGTPGPGGVADAVI